MKFFVKFQLANTTSLPGSLPFWETKTVACQGRDDQTEVFDKLLLDRRCYGLVVNIAAIEHDGGKDRVIRTAALAEYIRAEYLQAPATEEEEGAVPCKDFL